MLRSTYKATKNLKKVWTISLSMFGGGVQLVEKNEKCGPYCTIIKVCIILLIIVSVLHMEMFSLIFAVMIACAAWPAVSSTTTVNVAPLPQIATMSAFLGAFAVVFFLNAVVKVPNPNYTVGGILGARMLVLIVLSRYSWLLFREAGMNCRPVSDGPTPPGNPLMGAAFGGASQPAASGYAPAPQNHGVGRAAQPANNGFVAFQGSGHRLA